MLVVVAVLHSLLFNVFGMLVVAVVVLHSLLFDVIPHPFVNYRRVIRDTFILTSLGSSVTVLPRALRFWAGVYYPQAFFTLHSFPTFLAQPALIKASLGASSSSLNFLRLHSYLRNIALAQLFVWITTIHKSGIAVGSIDGLQLAGYLKNLLLAIFELFTRQVGCVKSCVDYLFGHRAIQCEINQYSRVFCNLCFKFSRIHNFAVILLWW